MLYLHTRHANFHFNWFEMNVNTFFLALEKGSNGQNGQIFLYPKGGFPLTS